MLCGSWIGQAFPMSISLMNAMNLWTEHRQRTIWDCPMRKYLRRWSPLLRTEEHYVFVIPIDEELDLKKCARSVGVKSVAMIHQKELFPLTGYVRGGCTAIGLKKNFVTRLDSHARQQDRIYISGGKVGCQILLAPDDFIKTAWKAQYADLTREHE